MRVLLVGDGAREHVIAQQLARSCELYSVMSRKNPGIAKLSQGSHVCPLTAIEVIGTWAIKKRIELAFVTSETALSAGLADALADAEISLACPKMDAAAAGNNTVYAFNLMDEAGIPHPDYAVCRNKSSIDVALLDFGSVVIKPLIRSEMRGMRFSEKDFASRKDIISHANRLIKRHGSVVLERMAQGEVFSLQAFTDGKKISAMPPVGVASRVLEGGLGELTEGVGGYSTGALLPFIRAQDYKTARQHLQKLIGTLRGRGITYKGVIHGRFLATAKGVQMLDMNSTMGPIEAVNNLGLLRTQLSDVLTSIVDSNLKSAAFDEAAAVTKYVLPSIYPKKIRKPYPVRIDEKLVWENGCRIFFEDVFREQGKYMLAGGRALALFARAKDLNEAEAKVESAMEAVSGKVKHRPDIGKQGFIRTRVQHMKELRG